MATLIEAIKEFVSSSKSDFNVEEEENSIVCSLQLDITNQPSRVYIAAHSESEPQTLDVLLVLPLRAPENNRAETALLLNALNFDMGLNLFLMDPKDGEIMTRFRFPCAGIEASGVFISYLLGGVCYRAEKWHEALVRVAFLGEKSSAVLESIPRQKSETGETSSLPPPTVEGQIGHA